MLSHTRRFRVKNLTRGICVAESVSKADGFLSRSVGLLGRKTLASEEGLWIVPCSMIHTFFMAFSIDVIFLADRVPLRGTAGTRSSHRAPGASIVLEHCERAEKGAGSGNQVLRVVRGLRPWRLSPWVFRAKSVLELPAGRSDGLVSVGDILEIQANTGQDPATGLEAETQEMQV